VESKFGVNANSDIILKNKLKKCVRISVARFAEVIKQLRELTILLHIILKSPRNGILLKMEI
jgi:hypothetical protein